MHGVAFLNFSLVITPCCYHTTIYLLHWASRGNKYFFLRLLLTSAASSSRGPFNFWHVRRLRCWQFYKRHTLGGGSKSTILSTSSNAHNMLVKCWLHTIVEGLKIGSKEDGYGDNMDKTRSIPWQFGECPRLGPFRGSSHIVFLFL